MKAEAHYKRREPDNVAFWGYKVESYEKARELINEDPENRMIELDLDVYIFDRIEDEEEKEERREDIFEFVQYLQDEGLFEHLEMRVVFMDERVLAPSYNDYNRELFLVEKEEKEIGEEDETVEMPPQEFRQKMSEELQQEIDAMSEEELLASMQEIRKADLVYDDLQGIRKWNSQYRALVYSEGMIRERYPSTYEDGTPALRNYDSIDDIKIGTYLEYVYKD